MTRADRFFLVLCILNIAAASVCRIEGDMLLMTGTLVASFVGGFWFVLGGE